MPSLAAHSIPSSSGQAWQRRIKPRAPSTWTLSTGTRCPVSHVYHVVCTHPGIANNARSPTQKFELTQNIMRLVLYV
ncbi:mCG148461, partial [Mus musculus]